MTNKRKSGLALIVLAVLLYAGFSFAGVAFDYPLLLVLAVVVLVVGAVLTIMGRHRKEPARS